ncbi:hypothetical protein EQM14_13065 [Caproiciproducens sp. NJN-50]|uniref:hypothetical protein n=1 Tax=Acutalibacteraceae TaxID=3082771 RepID=UPI000FFE1B05|nr:MULTISPECIES: hypothetical protein [Acutalibacteraceae]QAT50612.1 hypothetical protein EQM14_13065 [Caproiciproducens sp. NJN-50]
MDLGSDSGIPGIPAGSVLPINQDSDESYFLSLPEETQQALLKQNFSSEQQFHNALERQKEKE